MFKWEGPQPEIEDLGSDKTKKNFGNLYVSNMYLSEAQEKIVVEDEDQDIYISPYKVKIKFLVLAH